MITKPMLAAAVDDLDALTYPMIATRKLDGIRALIIGGKALTRSLKPIPNDHIRRALETLPDGLDGEIISGDTFQSTSSAVMGHQPAPGFTYYVFDLVADRLDVAYSTRIRTLASMNRHLPDWVVYVPSILIADRAALDAAIADERSMNGEGLCLRDPNGAYKCGRSTLKERGLLKVKFFEDSEARIVGFEEAQENQNEKQTNELGRSKRSSSKAGKVPKGTVGVIIAEDVYTDQQIRIGTGKGLTASLRQQMWDNQPTYIGRLVKYQFQSVGTKDSPRIPSFQGFRDARDMS